MLSYDFYILLFLSSIKNNFYPIFLFYFYLTKKHKIIKCESNLITHGKHSIVESIISISFEEIRVTTIDYRSIKIIGKPFPIRDQFGISVLHRWFLGWVKPPEFATFVEIEFAISGPNGHSIDIIRNSCKTFADFFRIISIHFFAHVSPVFRTLQQYRLFLLLCFIYILCFILGLISKITEKLSSEITIVVSVIGFSYLEEVSLSIFIRERSVYVPWQSFPWVRNELGIADCYTIWG